MTPPFTPPPLAPADRDLTIALLKRLYELPFDGFTRCVGLLLARMGYTNVRPAGRGNYRGSNHHRAGSGGYDLVADLPAPKGTAIRRFATISLKQFPPNAPARVFQRQVDEARGASLRAGASAALLISTGSVSPTVAHRETLPLAPIAPVSLVDGDELADLCVRFGVGIVPAEDGRSTEGGESTSVLDALFFDRLARTATGNGPTSFATRERQSIAQGNMLPLPEPSVPPKIFLSVRVSLTGDERGGNR